jgi:hypothetical protein
VLIQRSVNNTYRSAAAEQLADGDAVLSRYP